MVINGSQSAQQSLEQIQQKISTGSTVQFASDNPLAYQLGSQDQAALAQLNANTTAINQATTLTTANNSAMSSIHNIVSQASELATSVTSDMTTAQMQAVGTQMSSLISQLTSVVNQQSDGSYLFGGTANQAPVTSAGGYSTTTNGATQTIDVQQGNAVQTSIVAGRPGTPPVDGFLYDSSSGTDLLTTLQQTVTDLNAGNATAVQTNDLPALNSGLDHISAYVGSTAASLAAVTTASTINQQQITAQTQQLNSLTQTNLPNATIQLQQVQNQYEATLEAGSRLLNMSILNYLPSS
jgi:flagellin-like hook-associated protein FlgL